jgi:hypothetical protein
MISSAATTSDHFLRRSKDECVGRRSNEGYDPSLRGLLHYLMSSLMSSGGACKDDRQQDNVNDP